MYPTVPITVPGCVWPETVGALVCLPGAALPIVLRQAEIEDLDLAVLGDEEILGLQVPVDDAPLMGGPETLGDLLRVVRGFPLGDRTRCQHLAQRLALQKLHDGEGDAILRSEVEDREDVGMGQRRDRARLALEARKELRGLPTAYPGSTFTATSRLSFESRARYTSPIPPAPSGERIS